MICCSWGVLTGSVILGVANTAPFSGWSFGYYLAQISPILSITLLFFINFIYSKQEKQIKGILSATPVPYEKLVTIRCLVIAIGFLIQSGMVVLLSFIFYAAFFGYTETADFIGIAIMVLLPVFLFSIGMGRLAVNKKTIFLYGVIIIILGLSFLPLPHQIELFGSSFFQKYPSEIGGIEPPFKMPMEYLLNRICYTVIGSILFVVSARKEKGKKLLSKKSILIG